MKQTPALQYIQSKGWNFKPSGDGKIELETCPFCKKSNYGHFYMVISEDNKDGLYMCHKCGKSGNLNVLKEEQGDKIRGVDSRSDWAGKERKIEEMPDIEALHQALLESAEAMDYLVNIRGFSRDIIERQKIGYSVRWFRECGDKPAIIYPYLVQGNPVFLHWRSLPPAPKAFSSLIGWDAPLYNGEIIKEGLKELIMVEGEANVIAAMDKGIENVVGVPGANFKKALWIDALDSLNLDKIYICYDKDKVGQKAAQVLASRIGIERCWKIVLPDFAVPIEPGNEEDVRKGKDLNEWFIYGNGSAEEFEKLKEQAELFDVQGVTSSANALDELEDILNNRNSMAPTYDTPWKPLSKLVGFEDGDTIDIVAPEKVGKTTFGINLLEYEVDKTGEDGIVICLEMGIPRLARKWVSHVTNTPDVIPRNVEEDKALLEAMRRAIPIARNKAANRKGNLYFCYPQNIKDVEDAYKLIIDCIRRYGVKWVMFDNMQKLCDLTLKNQSHRTIHLSQISKRFDSIAKDYNIKFVRILQPHRIRDGAMITTDDVDGSSQIAKDCDCMITLHRKAANEMSEDEYESMGYVESETAFEPKMKVTVGLSRYSSGGYVTLEFNGATSTVSEYNPDIRIKPETRQLTGYELPTEKLNEAPVHVSL